MKNKFSTKWIASKQKRKQVKYVANAPLHVKRKFLGCNLSKTLREKHGKRTIAVRKGDQIKIMTGEFKGKKGKVGIVQVKRSRISVEGIQRLKKDGTKVNVFLKPSNLQIQELNLDDKKRMASLARKDNKKVNEEKTESKTKKEKVGEKK